MECDRTWLISILIDSYIPICMVRLASYKHRSIDMCTWYDELSILSAYKAVYLTHKLMNRASKELSPMFSFAYSTNTIWQMEILKLVILQRAVHYKYHRMQIRGCQDDDTSPGIRVAYSSCPLPQVSSSRGNKSGGVCFHVNQGEFIQAWWPSVKQLLDHRNIFWSWLCYLVSQKGPVQLQFCREWINVSGIKLAVTPI